jgi:hypothetical protein
MDPEDIRVRISCIENDVEIFSVNRPTQWTPKVEKQRKNLTNLESGGKGC